MMQQLQTKGEKTKTNMEINKLNAVVQYNKFIKDTEKADHCLSYYSVLYLLNCALFNDFFCEQDTKHKQKIKYKNFLHEVGRSWI
jgi:hypothetical protein